MIPHNRLTWDDREVDAVSDVIRSGHWASGPEVDRLEQDLARGTSRSHARVCSSGFTALQLALMALDVGPGDEVIVPAYSCVALPNSVRSRGATPVPVDVIPDDWTLDPKSTAQACTPKTRAVIAVHTFGQAAQIDDIRTEAGVPVIEDCSHGIAFPEKSPMGGRGDLAISSFYATKLVGGGEGGVVLFDDDSLVDDLDQYRDYTDQPESDRNANMKMSDVAAALIQAQFSRLGQFINRRRQLAEQYLSGLADIAGATGWRLPPDSTDRIWYRFPLFCRSETERHDIRAALRQADIRAENPVDDWRPDPSRHDISTIAYNQILSLPLYPSLQEQDVDQICKLVSSLGKT